MSDTPVGWRVAAVGLSSGAFALGLAASRRVGPASLLGLGGLLVGAYVLPICRGSRHPPLPPLAAADLPPSEALPTVSVVVAGRDEAAVVPALIADLAAQDHRAADGTPRFEVVVIDDRSTDGTGRAARNAANEAGLAAVTRVVRRGPPVAAGPDAIEAAGLPDGKGAALTAAQPETCRGEVVTVLDADARIGPEYVRRIASYVARGADAVTGRRRIVTHGQDGLAIVLAELQDDEQTADGEIQRGRWSLGGASEFRGDGISVRRDLLAGVGGWRAEALTEDLDLSSRLAAAYGTRVAWASDVVVWEEPVMTVGALWRQRRRWAEGIVRRNLDLTGPVLRSRRLPLRAKLDFLAYASQTLMPISLAGALAGGLLGGARRTGLVLTGLYLGAGTLVALDALRWTDGPDGRPLALPERLRRAMAVTLFSGHWLLALPAGWLRVAVGRGPVRYAKMAHVGVADGWRPTDEPATEPSAELDEAAEGA